MACTNIMGEDFYKGLDPILDVVNRNCIMMDENIKKKYVNIILSVVDFVIEGLKSTDEVFKHLYSKVVHVGSYFDGLRIAKPTEFDLNLIMQLPSAYQLEVENTNTTPGFVKIKVIPSQYSNQLPHTLVRTIDSWCDGSGYLMENRIRQWMESILVRYLGQGTKILYLTSGGTVEIRARKSGPVHTLCVNIRSDVIDVDLASAIQFPETKRPPSSIRWNNVLAASWVAIPKPSTDSRFWRLSFVYSERKLLHDQQKLKLINRFIKALRDSLDLQISSYCIKTLFLWEAHDCAQYNRKRFWEKSQGYLFVYMLNKLCTHLNENRLPFYWHSYFNQFSQLDRSHSVNMANQVSRIISKINELIRSKDDVQLKRYVLDLFKISDSDELSMANLHL